MATQLIGREKERAILKELLTTGESEFVALYGRKGGKHLQLENFTNTFNEKLPRTTQIPTPPTSWLKAFDILKHYLEGIKSKHKRVVFIDELPWLATGKSGFLSAGIVGQPSGRILFCWFAARRHRG